MFFGHPGSRTSRWAKRLAKSFFFLAFFVFLAFPPAHASPHGDRKELTTPGIMREFLAPISDVRQAVVSVQKDHIIHGTLVFDKEPVLTGAEAVNSTSLFEPWSGPGEVFYKIREEAISPRHFVDTRDRGTIGVRYVVIPITEDRTRVKVDAVYVESAHKNHASFRRQRGKK